MILSWSPIEGSFAVFGSRTSSIDTLWRLVPEDDRTPARRKLVTHRTRQASHDAGRRGRLTAWSQLHR